MQKSRINMFLENKHHLNRSFIFKPTPHPAELTVHSSTRSRKSDFPCEWPTTFESSQFSVTVPFTIIEWKLQYTVYWPLGLFSVSIKRHNENIVQHLPEHMFFLCFHAQNVMKCAVTCRCWLKMLTKPIDVSILLLWLKYQHMQQSPNVFCSNSQTNKHIL